MLPTSRRLTDVSGDETTEEGKSKKKGLDQPLREKNQKKTLMTEVIRKEKRKKLKREGGR